MGFAFRAAAVALLLAALLGAPSAAADPCAILRALAAAGHPVGHALSALGC